MLTIDPKDLRSCSCGATWLYRDSCPRCGRRSPTSQPEEEIRQSPPKERIERITLILPDIAVSANKLYAGMHHTRRKKMVDAWHTMAMECIENQGLQPYSAEFPVDVTCECLFGKGRRRSDADNLFPTAKMSIDALVTKGILPNDSPAFIRAVTLIPGFSQDKHSYTVIAIRPAQEG